MSLTGNAIMMTMIKKIKYYVTSITNVIISHETFANVYQPIKNHNKQHGKKA